jgi:NAD(P)-dependent dehydrogenase (short-subunit alcohol dehydrogenase family)
MSQDSGQFMDGRTMSEALDLSGSVAIITGGGTGIGRDLALSLARLGVKTVVCGRRLAPIAAVAATVREMGDQCLAIQCDVSSHLDVEKMVRDTIDKYGTVDILVNNAGVAGSAAIHEHPIEVWDQVMAVNLRGPFLTCRAVLPIMRSAGYGHIVNISSESGLEYYPGNGAYGVSKHALNALGEYIQRENQTYGIRVDTICPGMVLTPMSESAPGLNKERCLYPNEIAGLVCWLLTRRKNIKIGRPILIQTMENPWQ